tara:strand:- start:26 stop:799 length:774 start_codon:yes stop_codon:yes gene_type:complete
MSLKVRNKLEDLIQILKNLRSPDGCDWDKKQTHESLIPYLLEETYEVIEAIKTNDYKLLKEELGDLLLHIIFQAELASEKEKFNIYDSIQNINDKLIKRHPHIFDNQSDNSWGPENWESAKQKEKNRKSILDGVPKALPALTKARRIQEKAATVDFDWTTIKQVYNKIDEELSELREAVNQKQSTHIEDELGDVLFTIVNLSRHININPEIALDKSIDKFTDRFHKLEQYMKENELDFKEQSIEKLDKLWNKIKRIK